MGVTSGLFTGLAIGIVIGVLLWPMGIIVVAIIGIVRDRRRQRRLADEAVRLFAEAVKSGQVRTCGDVNHQTADALASLLLDDAAATKPEPEN